MITKEDVEKIDVFGMYKTYNMWPELAEEGYNSNLKVIDYKVSHFVFVGMGGSGAIGDIFASILSKENIHVDIVKGYHLPKTVNSDTLVVVTSISGNTSETLSVLEQAQTTNCKLIAFCNGGKMKDFCEKYNIEHKLISMKHSPRASFTIFLYSMLKVLSPILPIEKKDVVESIKILKELRDEIDTNNMSEKNPALNLAYWLDKIPIIYYPRGLQAAAIRFKNSIQENAKNHAIIEDVIESSHNGIMSWSSHSSRIKPILLQGSNDYIKTKERWQVFKKYFEVEKIEFKEVKTIDGSILAKLIHLIYLLDYTTIYLAVINGIDPTPVDAINFVKKHSSI